MTDQAPEAGTPASLPRWKVALFSAIMAVVVLGTLELAGRLYLSAFHGFDGEHLVQHEFDPYKNILPTRGFVDTRGITHNAQGFRHPTEVARKKPEGSIRVFLMGASTAYGTGGLWPHVDPNWPILHDSTTIAWYLGDMIAERFPDRDVEVVNAAITSTWTHHELIYLNQTVLGFDPDMIVFLDGFNDFFHTDPSHDQFANYAYGDQAWAILGPPTVRSLIQANLWWLYRKSAAFYVTSRSVRDIARALRRPGQPTLDVQAEMAGLRTVFPRNALRMVERNVLITEAAGAEAVFALQPLLILEGDRAGLEGIEAELYDFNVNSYLPNYGDFMEQAVPYVSELTREAVEARGGTYLDTNGIYHGSTGQIFTDYAHLTPLGNRILAEYLVETIDPMLRARLERADGN